VPRNSSSCSTCFNSSSRFGSSTSSVSFPEPSTGDFRWSLEPFWLMVASSCWQTANSVPGSNSPFSGLTWNREVRPSRRIAPLVVRVKRVPASEAESRSRDCYDRELTQEPAPRVVFLSGARTYQFEAEIGRACRNSLACRMLDFAHRNDCKAETRQLARIQRIIDQDVPTVMHPPSSGGVHASADRSLSMIHPARGRRGRRAALG